MISTLTGRLTAVGPDRVIIDVGGVGFTVIMPSSSLSALGLPGTTVKVHTHLHVREDNLSLFGFAAAEELSLFEMLLNVSGLGPKLALAMLSTLNPEQLATAIATGNTDVLEMVPGIGKKVASRLVLELKDKMGTGWFATSVPDGAGNHTEVVQALTSLGYSSAEALKAVSTLPPGDKLELEEKIKIALHYFTSD